ncbi:Uncharacterised protein [Mycobacteroides abscessus subsp. abscessus]|nr:Uncharacterised protein [Mycobacteroides abscessus subsp. abscessus]
MLAQGAAGADDIGDHIGHPELDGNLDGTIQPDDLGFDTFGGQILSDQIGVRGGDSLSRDVVDRPVPTCGRGVPEGRAPESQREPLGHRRIGVHHEIATGDPEIKLTRTDIDGYVLGPQEEELDVVLRVEHGQVLGVTTAPIARLGQDFRCCLAERPLVGDRDAQSTVGTGHLRAFGRRRRG